MNVAARPWFLLAALFAPLGVVAPKALVPLLFIAAIWRFGQGWRDGQWRRPFQGSNAVLAGAIAVWALLSCLWALDGAAALTTFAKLAAVLLATLVMLDGARRLEAEDSKFLFRVLAGTFVLAAILLGFETLSGAAGHEWLVWRGRRAEFDLTVLNRAGVLLLLAAWPVALVLWRRGHGVLAGLAIVATLAVVLLGVSSANQAAAVVGLAGAVAAWFLGRRFSRLLAFVLAVGVLAAPVLPTTLLAPKDIARHFDAAHYSGLHRLYIWHFTARRIAEAPVMGWGLDGARRIPGGDTKLPGGGNVMSMHPHNASLQIWLELGAVGALLAALLVAGLCRRAAALPHRADRAAATGLLLSALTVTNLSFGIWQTWWLAALGLAGIVFTLALRLNGNTKAR
ncbi:MAG: O-antigen ligase family protein [Alphaproteobacteria bacterium]